MSLAADPGPAVLAAAPAIDACPPAHRRMHRWLLAIVLATFVLAQLWDLGLWRLGNGRFLATEWREADTATIARNFLAEPNLLYPRINWGAPGPGYVETEFQLYPFAVHLLYRLFGPDPWFGQLLSVLVSAGSCYVLHRLARRFLPRWPALLAVAAFASSPLLFRYARGFMPDTTALLCYLIAAERFLAHAQNRRARPLFAAAIALALAILIKPTAIHLGLFCGLLVWWQHGLRAALAPRMLVFGGIALLPGIVFFRHAMALHSTYGNTFGVISGGDSKWGGPTYWFDPHFYLRLARIDLWDAFGIGGCALAALGLLRWQRGSFRAVEAIWLGVIFVYYLIVARYAGNEAAGKHYHLFVVAPGALAVGGGAVVLHDWLRQRGWPARRTLFLVLLPITLLFGQQWRRDRLLANYQSIPACRAAGVELARLSAAEDLVVVTSTTSRIDHGVADNFEDPRILFYAWRRGRLLPADELRAAELQRAHAIGARWLVVLDEVLPQAQPDFLAALADLQLAASGEGFKIYRLPG